MKNNMKTTTNRGEFNRAYKKHLEQTGKIKCGYCRYHRGENSIGKKYYGGFDDDIKYPNWKLTSKNKKQYMKKQFKMLRKYGYLRRGYIEIVF